MFGSTQKAAKLMQAMAEHEGWLPAGSKECPNGSRSWRNHNPGNLRASPFAAASTDNFAVFRDDFTGYMAFHWDLIQKARGNTSTGLGPTSTLRALIFTWAPPSDNNNSEAYLQAVVARTGIKETETLAEIFAV